MKRKVGLAVLLAVMVVGMPASAGVDYYDSAEIVWPWIGFGGGGLLPAITYKVSAWLMSAAPGDTVLLAEDIPHLGEWQEHSATVLIYSGEHDVTELRVWGRDALTGRVAVCRDTVAVLPPLVPHGCGCAVMGG